MARKARKKACHQSEMALLKATPILCFYGQSIVESRELALLTATKLSQYYKEDQLLFFADGAVHLVAKNEGSQDTLKEKEGGNSTWPLQLRTKPQKRADGNLFLSQCLKAGRSTTLRLK